MKSEILIAIISGGVTLIASLILAAYRTRLEVKKALRQLEESYTKSLYEKRLSVYPVLYKLLVDQNNLIERKQHSLERLKEFDEAYSDWMSVNGIYLTSTVASAAWNYRYYLMELIRKADEAGEADMNWEEIYQFQQTLGKFLRAEIGIYDTEPAGVTDLKKPHILRMLSSFADSKERIRNQLAD